MDGLDVLTADHNRLRGLFTRFQAAHENNDITAMGELAEQIFTELEVHTAIEEQIFYPAVHDLSEELDEVVDEGVQEHHVVDVLIEEARALRPSDAEWVAKLTVLIESVEHHAEEEETELFPQVRMMEVVVAGGVSGGRLTTRSRRLGSTVQPVNVVGDE